MTFRNHTPALLTLALLTACATEPAHADVLLEPASVPLDPARPGWRPSISRPGVPAGADPAGLHRGGHVDAAGSGREPSAIDTYGRWQGAPAGALPGAMAPWLVTCRPSRPVPEDDAVPGPVGLTGVAAAWGYSRKLRQRIR